jgi:hypothetical protein
MTYAYADAGQHMLAGCEEALQAQVDRPIRKCSACHDRAHRMRFAPGQNKIKIKN